MGSVNISTTGDGGPGSLTLGALTRRPGTRVRFTTGDFGLGPDQSLAVGQLGGHVYFATPPTLNDGLIGGWAVVSRSYPRFAGYGPAGVESVAGTGQDVNVAAPETNLELGASAVLASSRTVNSLRVAHPAALDLGGHTLTVDSGGVIIHGSDAAGPPNLYNGTLVPGPSAGGEMYFYGGRITATVADGPGGPTTPVFDGVTYLGGASTYTGATYVNGDAVLHLTGPDALPAGTDAVLDEGTVIFDYNSATPLKLGALRMRGHGGGGIVGGQRPVDAAAYDLELGRITSGLAGSGPMTKRTDGTVQITGGDRSAFTGTVDVLAGVLQVDSLGDGPATGRVRVDPGAEVRVAGWLDNPIELRGGGITGLASFAVPLRGAVRATRRCGRWRCPGRSRSTPA
jgi:autotransporter-associated beta strand protein